MSDRISPDKQAAIVAELRANEFRAGEFHVALAEKYEVAWYAVRDLAARAKRGTV